MSQNNNDTVYGFFRAKLPNQLATKLDGKDLGYVCVRLDRPPKDSDSTEYKASFSFCSPMDAPQIPNKHFRALAKKIADSRMNTKRVPASITFNFKKDGNKLPVIFEHALKIAMETPKPNKPEKKMVPDWVLRSDLEYGYRPLS